MSKCQFIFLPPEEKLPEVLDVQHDALKNFLNWFDKTYISGEFRRVRGMRMQFDSAGSLSSFHLLFNIYEPTLHGEFGTNSYW